jgi:hypothetical protein
MDTQHPLYYHCRYNPTYERYGLLRQRDNSFYIIDNDPTLLKNVQLTIAKYEFLHFVNIDHYFNFLPTVNTTINKYQIDTLTKHHNDHIKHAAVFRNDNHRTKEIQFTINNDNCKLFGLTVASARSLPMDVSHYRLEDNIIRHSDESKIFDKNVQEKIFLIRHLLYLLKSTVEYLNQFTTLQDQISVLGTNVANDFFKICNPYDEKIDVLIKKESEANDLRHKSIKYYYNTIFKYLNSINLEQTNKDIILQFKNFVQNDRISDDEAKKDYPDYVHTYDIYRIKRVVEDETIKLLKHYD